MNDTVMLDGPKTITLSPQHMAIVLDSLANGQFKQVNPVIVSIMAQLKLQEPKQSEVNREEVNPPPNGHCPPDSFDGVQSAR